MWIAGISPDTEWAAYPDPGPYRTRDEAVAAIRAMGAMAEPDEYGAEPHPWVMRVTREEIHGWTPERCTCYGRHYCPACLLARELA